MPHHRYLIIGGGMTADAAARGIRAVDASGSVGIVSTEIDPPYDRPPLTKGLWHGDSEERIWRETRALDVQLHLGRRILRLDRDQHTATDDRGVVYTYDRLLLATGLVPKVLPDAVPQVVYLRTLEDYRRLRKLVDQGRRVAVIGGGYIGCEIAASLAENGKEVTMLFPEERLCTAFGPPALGDRVGELFRERGVDLRPGVTVRTVRRNGPRLLVAVAGDAPETLKVDAVVAGLGCDPNTALAEGAGLECEDGIVVDGSFRTSDPDVFAAGDVAAFWSVVFGRTMRIEHEDHANASGAFAGSVMAGSEGTYDHIPFFYSKFFDVHYDAVGEVAADMDRIEDWDEPQESGVIYYLRGGRVRGVLLWNQQGRIKDARALIRGEESTLSFDPGLRLRFG